MRNGENIKTLEESLAGFGMVLNEGKQVIVISDNDAKEMAQGLNEAAARQIRKQLEGLGLSNKWIEDMMFNVYTDIKSSAEFRDIIDLYRYTIAQYLK